MKVLSRDITITLSIKLLLLVLLWCFCVKGKHFVGSSYQEWMLGKNTISNPSPTNHLR